MLTCFRLGQLVRLIGIPSGLPADTEDLSTETLFRACLGRTFAITDINQGIVALDVGEVLGLLPWKHTIHVEPELLEPASGKDR